MAKQEILVPFIKSWEGGFANHPKDPGGATMRGITLATFRSAFGKGKSVDDLKNLTDEEWNTVFRRFFWDRWRADEIKSQSIANILVDWIWASGSHSIIKTQQLLGVRADGKVGPQTLNAINSQDSKLLFERLFERRRKFIFSCRNFETFGKGWLNRLNSIGYGWLANNGSKTKSFFTP